HAPDMFGLIVIQRDARPLLKISSCADSADQISNWNLLTQCRRMPRPESKKSAAGEDAAQSAAPDHVSGDSGHLANIEKLLNATYDLMKQDPTLDGAAFEHLRQLRVKVRYAISAASSDQTSLPNRPPQRWHQRADRSQSALSFLVEWYRPWLEA